MNILVRNSRFDVTCQEAARNNVVDSLEEYVQLSTFLVNLQV